LEVFIQLEIVRFNKLLKVVKAVFRDLESALKGETNVSEAHEAILAKFRINVIPDSFLKVGYPSLKPLNLWFQDLKKRVAFY